MPWIKKAFHHTSSQQNDPFRLKCWVRVDETEGVEKNSDNNNDDDYLPFDQYDTKVWIPQYTLEEYDAFLAMDNWSFEETNYLIRLCELYHLRFIVIADRYQFNDGSGTRKRSIEDLKERYYFVCRKLEKLKGPPPSMQSSSSNPTFQYSKRDDLERKKELEKLYARNQEQIIEEAFLSQQLVGILQSYDQIIRDREEAIRMHIGDVFLNRFINIPHKESMYLKSPSGEDITNKSQHRKRTSARQQQPTSIDGIASIELAGPSGEARSKHPSPTGSSVYLRSSKLHPIKIAFIKQVEKFMTDHSLPNKPLYATEEFCNLYDELKQLVLGTFEMKRSSSSTSLLGNPEKKQKSF